MPCSPRGDDSPKLGGELSESANVCDTVKYPSAHGQDRPPRLVMLSSSRFVLLHDAEASANGDVSSSVGGSGNGDGNDAHVPLEDKDMVFHSSWERRLLRYCGNMQFNSNSRALVVVAWFGAIASMLSLATIIPIFLYLQREGTQPFLAAAWRNTCMLFYLFIPSLIETIARPPGERFAWVRTHEEKRWSVPVYLALHSVSWGLSLMLTVTSLRYTTTTRAALFGTLYPLMLVAYFRFTGVRISMGENVGVVLATVGVAVTVLTAASESSDQRASERPAGQELIGDAMNILASAMVGANVVMGGYARRFIPVFSYSFILVGSVAVLLSIASLAFEGSSVDASITGVFGWSSERFAGVMMFFAFMTVICVVGYNFSIRYMDPVIFSTVMQLNPALTGAISSVWGLEGLPSLSTFLGGSIIISGIACLTYFESKRKRAEATATATATASTAAPSDRSNDSVSLSQMPPPPPPREVALTYEGPSDDDGDSDELH